MDTITVTVDEAKSQLSDLLHRVVTGDTVFIEDKGLLIAELRAVEHAHETSAMNTKQWNLPDRKGLLEALTPDPDVEKLFYGH